MENGKETTAVQKKKKKKTGKRVLLVLVLILAAGLGIFFYYKTRQAKSAAASAVQVQTATVGRMDISSTLTESSSLKPKDTYEITSLVEGEILECYFEVGDRVEKDQILYVIDASSTDSSLSSAKTSLVRAQESLQTAQEEYNEADSKLSGNTYKSTNTGYIKTLYLNAGDKIGNGTKLADLYDDSVMKLTVPFLSAQADQIAVGSTAIITIEDTGEQLEGTVTVVSGREEALAGGRLVKTVTVETANPGGLTTVMQATVSVGDFICSQEGTFAPKTEITMTADLPGNKSLEASALLVNEGTYVERGTPLFQITPKSASDYLKSFKDSLDSAGDSVTNAENKLKDVEDNIDAYTITAPISGTIISKNSKVGDNITRSSGNSATVMAVIYDLSAMTLEMSVDELDVASVKAGQTVELTADAVEGTTFTGYVTNVSLQSSYSNGVSTYPVTVTIEEYGDLLPGMNVDASIVTESSEQALVIPVGSLMRGNRVYVSEDSPTAQALVQETEKKERESDTKEDGSAPSLPSASGDSSKQRTNGASNVPSGFVAVAVKTGVVNDDYVEILSGLQEGDVVYVDPSSGTSSVNMFQMMGPGGMGGGMGGGPGDRMGSGMGGGRP